jgi:putative effector of murein hydrolase LrgA (UPF0299 family)
MGLFLMPSEVSIMPQHTASSRAAGFKPILCVMIDTFCMTGDMLLS